MKLLHTMIRVKDISAGLRFCTELLNMKLEKEKRLGDCKLYFLTDEEGSNHPELTYNDLTPEQGYDSGSAFGHFAFSVKLLDEFVEKLHPPGYEYMYEPFDSNGKGAKIAFIKDPGGCEIEMIEKVVW